MVLSLNPKIIDIHLITGLTFRFITTALSTETQLCIIVPYLTLIMLLHSPPPPPKKKNKK